MLHLEELAEILRQGPRFKSNRNLPLGMGHTSTRMVSSRKQEVEEQPTRTSLWSASLKVTPSEDTLQCLKQHALASMTTATLQNTIKSRDATALTTIAMTLI